MQRLDRRRFLSISAAVMAASTLPANAVPLTRWRGVALGASASIMLAHPEADRLLAAARAEIARLEAIFSLYRPGSALMRLNAAGSIASPPFELLECLGLCGHLHGATGGLFDPTVQPLWATYAQAHSAGHPPSDRDIDRARALVGWAGLRFDPSGVAFDRPGMALTLNGIAQGFIADRVAGLLAAEGLTDILVDTGELRALGSTPTGGDWPVDLADGAGSLGLRDQALASSAPLGTVFDAAGTAGHILDPRSGATARPRFRLVSVTAPSAALADGLSTALCLMDRPQIDATLARFPAARLAYLG